jgi:hypothetical protein
MPSPDLTDYVTVAQRIAQFRDKHPAGCLRPLDPAQPYEIRQIGDATMIIVVAAAYRTPDDPTPGVGMAAEPFPGRTPYTRGSELMNAETSAWGRAIVAVLAADTSLAIASQDEVRNRREDGLPVNRDGSLARSQVTDEQRAAAGVMTSGQAREHGQLRKLDQPRPADRSNDPADDMWGGATGQLGRELAKVPEHQFGSSNSKQHQQLGVLYGQLGITDRDDRLGDMRSRVGRSITSAKDLSYAEAEAAIRELRPVANAVKEA